MVHTFRSSILIASALLAMASPTYAGESLAAQGATDTASVQGQRHLPQVPGVYRFDVGAFRISALSDGTLPLDLRILRGIDPGMLKTLLDKGFVTDPIETSINAFVVDTGSRVILVDTGAGELFGAVAGKLPASLAAAGYQTEQVTDVLITHIHTDHSGGLTRDGGRVFQNATVHIAEQDVSFFLDRNNVGDGLELKYHEEAVKTVQPYVDAGRVKTFSGESRLLPGVTAIPTPGHTPGHSFFRIDSEGQSIEFWGDIMHVGPVQFPRPDVTITFDVDQDAARAQRAAQFERVAAARTLTAVAHLSFPGLGYLRRNGEGYDWVPVTYRDRD